MTPGRPLLRCNTPSVPESRSRWQAVAHEGAARRQLGSFAALFGDRRWRKNAIVGLCLAFSGVVGLWGIGFFTPELMSPVYSRHFQGQGLSDQETSAGVYFWVGVTLIVQNIGGEMSTGR